MAMSWSLAQQRIQQHLEHNNKGGEEEMASLLIHRGNMLATAHESTRDITQLDEAVSLVHRAIHSISEENDKFPSWCHNLGVILASRYEQTGAMQDLEDSIRWSSAAVIRTPKDHLRRASRCNGLATILGRRYERTHCPDDLKNAFIYSAHAISSCCLQDRDYLVHVHHLGYLYALGFQFTGCVEYIDAAIQLTKEVVQFSVGEPERRVRWIGNLGTMMYWKYQCTADVKDHADAVIYAQEAARESSKYPPSHPVIISNLADLLTHNYGNSESQRQSLEYYLEAWGCVSAPTRQRLGFALKAANHLILLTRWEEASDLLCKAVELLSSMNFQSLTHSDIQHILRESTGLATLTASVILQAGQGVLLALITIERGRGILAGLHMRNLAEGSGDDASMGRPLPCSTSQPERDVAEGMYNHGLEVL